MSDREKAKESLNIILQMNEMTLKETDNSKDIYSQLHDTLTCGREAILVTTCGPTGVSKELHASFSFADWEEKLGDDNSLHVERVGGITSITEYFLPRPRMIIFGGGHIALPISRMASMLKFEVVVYDDRPMFANDARFPDADRVICDDFQKIGNNISIRRSDYVVIVTRGHRHDQECLRFALNGEAPYYMGMIGSRRRVAIVRGRMLEEGYAQSLADQLHSPIGLEIGAITPEEIAVSILAEVVREKRNGGLRGETPLPSWRYRECYADMELMGWLANGERPPASLVTVLSAEGSTPRESGAKMAVTSDGRTIGSIGGGCAEADVIRDCMDIIQKGGYLFRKIDMTDSAEDDGMVCGGIMEVLIEALTRDS
ncbi:MAG: XdhC family protein [Synergistaceae bacterium]|jgi:xanthine dehydrogenase accessory factor|nr:XdhC family protein [Synergistaceae bacterium]